MKKYLLCGLIGATVIYAFLVLLFNPLDNFITGNHSETGTTLCNIGFVVIVVLWSAEVIYIIVDAVRGLYRRIKEKYNARKDNEDE